ncbi:MAG TPA: glycosyltransferase 87 family protein [Streptosporangiaceae bacterium]
MTAPATPAPGTAAPATPAPGTTTPVRAAAAAAAAAALTTLVVIAVHPAPVTAVIGTTPLAVILWAVFAGGAWLVLRLPGRWAAALIVIGGIAVQLAALSAAPQGSDDSYRYIWDGRVQAAGVDPYQYAPAAPKLASLRDPFLWPAQAPHCVTAGTRLMNSTQLAAPGCTRINRPIVHTIYPPVAEAYFLAVHVLSPPGSGSTPIQAAAALCAVLVTVLLLYGLPRVGRDPRLAVLWAWCPTVALEAGNNAHVDVLAAGITAAALILLARPGALNSSTGAGFAAGPLRRPMAGGALLALAIWTKVTPVLIVPAVLRRRRPAAVITAGVAATVIVYLPHVLAVGSGVIGFLPGYLQQEGYANGSRFLLLGMLVPGKWGFAAAFAVLATVALAVLLRGDPDRPWRGAVVLTGVALAVATPPFPWYAMLLVLLVAFDGRVEWLGLAMVRYLAVSSPLPGVHVPVLDALRAAYGLALAVVVTVALIRWHRSRILARPAPAPALPAAPEAIPVSQ